MKRVARSLLVAVLLVVGGVSTADDYKYIISPGDPAVKPAAAYSTYGTCILSLKGGDVSAADEMEARYRTVAYSPCIPLKTTSLTGLYIYIR